MCTTKKGGRKELSFGRIFPQKKREIFWWVPFARRRLLCSRIQRHEKKTEKRTQKTLYFTLPKTYWVSPKLQKSDDDDDERGTVHTRPIDRRPPREETLVFFDARARERERDVFLLGCRFRTLRIHHRIPFRVPPTPLLWGSNFQSKRRRRFRSPSRDERRANRRAATRANRQRCARVRANG